MIVKVCGVRDPGIAEVAIDAGADWLGLVFEPRSPRFADDVAARAVAAAARGRADLVGVFVEPTASACDEAAERYGLAAVQVHGRVARDLVDACSVPVIRGINVQRAADAVALDWWPDLLVLIDAPAAEGALPGGGGQPLDHALAADIARHRPVILAGGLEATTVAAAIRAVRPAGVDASSRLESAPGVKDPVLVERYVRTARDADTAVRERS